MALTVRRGHWRYKVDIGHFRSTDQKVAGSNPAERAKSPGETLTLSTCVSNIANNPLQDGLKVLRIVPKRIFRKANKSVQRRRIGRDRLRLDETASF